MVVKLQALLGKYELRKKNVFLRQKMRAQTWVQ